jgi:hypothetical protein
MAGSGVAGARSRSMGAARFARLDTTCAAQDTEPVANLGSQANDWDLLSLSADLALVSVQAGEQLVLQGVPAPAI